jgi:hypothetical protein
VSLVQIVYISRATFVPPEKAQGIEPNVARILAKSRINNRRNGLVGVLYFGNSCFFQCLEGETSAVDALYARLESDPRHKDITLLSRTPIEALSFSSWDMKYVPLEREMGELLAKNGHQTFDPYRFDAAMTQKVMHLLQTNMDAAAVAKMDRMIEKAAKVGGTPRSFALGEVVALVAVGAVVGFAAGELL